MDDQRYLVTAFPLLFQLINQSLMFLVDNLVNLQMKKFLLRIRKHLTLRRQLPRTWVLILPLSQLT